MTEFLQSTREHDATRHAQTPPPPTTTAGPMLTALGILVGILVVCAITALTGYFVAQEFAYMAVDRSRLKARAEA